MINIPVSLDNSLYSNHSIDPKPSEGKVNIYKTGEIFK